jgi:hypothetical protein
VPLTAIATTNVASIVVESLRRARSICLFFSYLLVRVRIIS